MDSSIDFQIASDAMTYVKWGVLRHNKSISLNRIGEGVGD